MAVFVTLFTTDFIEVQQCKKGLNFCWTSQVSLPES